MNDLNKLLEICFGISISMPFIGFGIQSSINKKINKREKYLKKLNKLIDKPVLVILDNIERIRKDSWEIIKTLQKLAELDNFIFLLSLKIKKVKWSFSN